MKLEALPLRDFTAEEILLSLRKQGMRITKNRRAILAVLFQAERPLSLQEIQERAATRSKPGPDYATVFRMLTLLEELGLAQKVNLQKSCSFFELRNPSKHYDHLVCRSCGTVTVLELPCPVREAEKTLRTKFGYTALTHSLEFFGLCPSCQTAGAAG